MGKNRLDKTPFLCGTADNIMSLLMGRQRLNWEKGQMWLVPAEIRACFYQLSQNANFSQNFAAIDHVF